MTDFFIIEGDQVLPSPEVLMISEFEELWKRDRTKKKNRALAEMKFIHLMYGFGSPFAGYTDLEVRKEKILATLDVDLDKKVQAAIEKYLELRNQASPSIEFFEAATHALHQVSVYLNQVDFTRTDERGQPLYTVKEVMEAIKQASPMMASIQEFKKKVQTEEYESKKTRGDRPINPFEK